VIEALSLIRETNKIIQNAMEESRRRANVFEVQRKMADDYKVIFVNHFFF
jgi:hypothetical protein